MGIELLDGVRQKLIRAREHLETFQSDVTSYAASDPYRIVRKFEDHIPEKSGRPGLTWRAKVDAPPSLLLAVIAGDCLHNLRSALDHLAWALVLENGGEPSDTNPKTQFPDPAEPTHNQERAAQATHHSRQDRGAGSRSRDTRGDAPAVQRRA